MSTLTPIVFCAGMIALALHYRNQLFKREPSHDLRWFLKWTLRGVALPVIVWIFLNAGSHPVMPALARVRPPTGPGWFGAVWYELRYLAAQTRPALLVISSYWAALTFGWFVVVSGRHAEDRRDFLRTSLIWCVITLPFVALMLFWFGPAILGLALLFCFWPLAHQVLWLRPVETGPVYARAVAKMKFGKYREAEKAILGELEKCETDFDGWLMLAELYAKQYHDVAEAERTVNELCADPATTESQAAIALNRLADWQLQYHSDPAAARRSLEEIGRRMPGTHLAKMAGLRLNSIPTTDKAWKESQQPRTIHLPPLHDHLESGRDETAPAISQSDALAKVNQYVEVLNEDPNDVEVREKLAEILAEQLGKVDLAVEQIEALMEMPEQPAPKLAAWLAQMAAWEIRRGNHDAARKFLRRLISEHPRSVQAFTAQRHLSLLEAEARTAKTGSTDGAALAADNAV